MEGGGLRGEHRGAGWRGGDRLLCSAGLSDRDNVPGGAGGATSVVGGGHRLEVVSAGPLSSPC